MHTVSLCVNNWTTAAKRGADAHLAASLLRSLSEPIQNILLIEGIHDLFAARQPIEDLWQKWEQPEIWRLPHGHISAQLVLGLMGRVLRWLAPRLEAGGKNNA